MQYLGESLSGFEAMFVSNPWSKLYKSSFTVTQQNKTRDLRKLIFTKRMKIHFTKDKEWKHL